MKTASGRSDGIAWILAEPLALVKGRELSCEEGGSLVILVTGAGGNCGRELLRQLTDAGVPHRAGYSTSVKAEDARSRGIDAVVADFRQTATLGPALRGIESLFLLSGWSPDQTQIETNLVREAKRAAVRHIVKLSVWDAGAEQFSFARIHRPVELEIEASGIPWTILRPNGFMQNVSNFLASTIRGQSTLYAPSIQVPISHVDVRDVARVAAIALTRAGHEGRTYELSGPSALTYRQMASTLTDTLGRGISCVEVPLGELGASMVRAGAPSAYADAVVDLTRYYSEGHAARISPDIKNVTGVDPTPFDQFVRDYIAAFH